MQPEHPQEPEQPLLQLPQLPLQLQEQPVWAVHLEQPQEPEREEPEQLLYPQEPEQPQELEQPLLQPQDEHLLQELQMLEQELLEHVIFNQNLLFSGLLHPIPPAGKV